MMFGNNPVCQFDEEEEIIEPKTKKATKKRKSTAMLLNEQNKRLAKLEKQLKDFCEKWEWLDLEDADQTLTGCEQKIWELMKKNAQLKQDYMMLEETLGNADDWNEDLLKENRKLKDDVNNLEQLCSICQKEQENDRLKAKLEEQERELKYYEDEWKSCLQHLDHYKGECLNLQDQLKEGMQEADKTIKVLEKALEWACEKVDCDDCPLTMKCESWAGIKEGCRVALSKHFKEQARKELENE